MSASRLRSKHGAYTLVPNAFITSNVSHEAFRLYVVLLSHAKGNASDGGEVFPSYDKLLEVTGIKSYSTIAKRLRELESSGWLERRKRFGKSTVYTLTSPTHDVAQQASTVLHGMECITTPGVVQSYTPSQTNKTHLTRHTEQDNGASAPRVPISSPPKPSAQTHFGPAEHALARKEKVEREGRWRVLLRNASKPGMERALEIAIAFVELTRIEPSTDKQARGEISAAREIVDGGATVDDVRAAWSKSERGRAFQVTDLHSLKRTAIALAAERKRANRPTRKRVGWRENELGESVPVYAEVAA